MRTEFTIDRVAYVAEFTERHEFQLYVDAEHSGRIVYEMSSFERGFWDKPPETVWATTGTGHVFEVKRHIEDFIHRALQRYRPHYFTYTANEFVKVKVYRRFAERLCKRHGYTLAVSEDGATFRFTQKAKWDADSDGGRRRRRSATLKTQTNSTDG